MRSLGDTLNSGDRLQASWVITEHISTSNTTHEIIGLTIPVDEQPDAASNSTHTGKDVERSRVDGVESNTNADAGVDPNSNANDNINYHAQSNVNCDSASTSTSNSNSNSNSDLKISPDEPYANTNPTSPSTTKGAQTTTHTEASESQVQNGDSEIEKKVDCEVVKVVKTAAPGPRRIVDEKVACGEGGESDGDE
ncbi:hypothetical protein BJ165DRAFT_644378 [Panaeolus papilionaceus]|nr:hypothetical protein BJ165DRAFT_644378 [Panaeolus papilionaceus]